MNATQLVDTLLESDPDDVSAKHYVGAVANDLIYATLKQIEAAGQS